jgi:hypothetical protein
MGNCKFRTTILWCAVLMFLMGHLGSSGAQDVSQPVVRQAVAPRISEALAARTFGAVRVWQPGDPVIERGDLAAVGQLAPISRPLSPDPLLQRPATLGPGREQPSIVAQFDGIPATGFVPPDTVGAIGPNHYVQMVNAAFAIFDKSGNRLLGPAPINSLFSGFGGPCETQNSGDPIVRYDHLADRWLISQFTLPTADFQCIAISRGPNPVTDGWFLYAFPTQTPSGQNVTPDYPKIGIWPDGYYMGTQRGFPNGGLDVWVFERSAMLAGNPARQVQFSVSAPSLFLMPSDLDGPPPPQGTPNVFVRHVDGAQFGGQARLELFEFAVNWGDPSRSTFAKILSLPTTPFSAVLCSDAFSGVCVDQPGTTQKLETLPAWLMWRLQYRDFGSYQTLVTNHTIDADGRSRAGIRWYELRKTANGAWSLFQEGTHSPDGAHRWMGSIAMDDAGNIALGYSVSSGTIFPSIRVATRKRDDPLGTLSQNELTLQAGGGSQTTTFARWGDYSSMDIDPAQSCVFWYTTEYYAAISDAGWRTKVGAFRMPGCGAQELAGYTFCANENQHCSFSGTKNVAYGANGKFAYQTATNGTDCNNATFGDPIVGTVKACYTGPEGYAFCAAENGNCGFSGTKNVAYGANGKFAYQTATNGIGCNNATFGDPIVGTVKACYTK